MEQSSAHGGRTFEALVVEEAGDTFVRGIRQRRLEDLPAGDVLVRVAYSSLNYKDALSATGHRGITRHYPHTPGVDAAGVVVASDAPAFAPGDPVIVTGFDLGMNTPGGFGQYIRVPAPWLVPLPAGLTLEESMALGTAGFTAGLAADALLGAGTPADGDVLVTGASGGVGSMAVAILARLGYPVVAATGKAGAADFLRGLGAREVIGREAVMEDAAKPLGRVRWGGVVDTVGGDMLVSAIKATRPFGLVTCSGMVASERLDLTVFPFILRGVTLKGINSQTCPMDQRLVVWERLAGEWKPPGLDAIARQVGLAEVNDCIDEILAGRLTGRIVVRLGAED